MHFVHVLVQTFFFFGWLFSKPTLALNIKEETIVSNILHCNNIIRVYDQIIKLLAALI